MRAQVSFLAFAAVAYLSLVALMYATQRSQMYFPTPESMVPGAEARWIDSDGERIKVWVVARPGARALIYFGGNAEDVAGTADSLAAAFPDRSLFLVNYRGYGGSSGRPSEAGLVTDALAIFDHVHRQRGEVAVMGRSLGSGVAVQLASRRPVERLVLVTAYDSLVNVARGHLWWLPVGLLMRDRYESARHAGDVQAPVLIVIAGSDEIIPRQRSDALAAAFAPGQALVAVVPETGHNTLDWSPAYLDAVSQFLVPAGGPRSGRCTT